MAKKKKLVGVLYSTNQNWTPEYKSEEEETLPKNQQKLRVRLETKHRNGKKATIVQGFIGTQADLEDLAKILKTKLGVGGSAKDGEIIVQGDYTEKTKQILKDQGYNDTK